MSNQRAFQVDRNKEHKGDNVFKKGRNFNKSGENNSKSERLMEGIGTWSSFYRSNPHRFVSEYLSINLKLFQQILLFMMNYCVYVMYLASRGQGR